MVGSTQLAVSTRDRFLEAAQKELAAFERKENEFRRSLLKERAEQLQLPLGAARNIAFKKTR